MAAELEDLTEEEKYLYAIITDPSGLDLAEFCWHEASDDETDGCWRARPYQWRWFRDSNPLQIDQCGRSVGKSLSIKLRAFAFPFNWPDKEMVITAPELNHLEAVTELVEGKFYDTRLGREILQTKRGGVTHRPFSMKFENGSRIMGRIPQKDGRGVKGVHPIFLELDEAQDYPEKGWLELIETLQRDVEGSMWRAHGVTRGVGDFFYKFTTDPNSRWKVHRITALHRPGWTDEERQEKIEMYGGATNPDYRRNVLGLHGDALSPIFVSTRLMAGVDDDQSSDYNTEEYTHIRMDDSLLAELRGEQSEDSIIPFIPLPHDHIGSGVYKVFWVGMDIGLTRDPSEILVFAEYRMTKEEERHNKRTVKDDYGVVLPKKAVPRDGQSRLKLLTRISLQRIGAPDQADVIAHVINHYKPKAFTMDATGMGLPIYQYFQHDYKELVDIIKGYGFSEKILVDFDERKKTDEFMGDPIKDQGMMAPVLEYSTEILRRLVDSGRLWLPWDTELIGEFQGQSYVLDRGVLDSYGRKRFTKGSFHTLDAARMAVLGHKQYTIDQVVANQQKREDVIDMPLFMS